MSGEAFEWDSFICHASEDKATFVAPLVEALREQGFRIWYDEFVLEVGDSLREKIDEGLAQSRFGVVVLSKAFFEKNWTKWELDGLAAREMGSGEKVILPVWHGVTTEEVAGYSLPLSGKMAARSEEGLVVVVQKLGRVLRWHLKASPRPSPQARANAREKVRASSAGPVTFQQRLKKQLDKERREREAKAAEEKWRARRDELVLAGYQDAILTVCAEIEGLATGAQEALGEDGRKLRVENHGRQVDVNYGRYHLHVRYEQRFSNVPDGVAYVLVNKHIPDETFRGDWEDIIKQTFPLDASRGGVLAWEYHGVLLSHRELAEWCLNRLIDAAQ